MSFFLGKHEIFVFSWESDSFAADRIMLKKQLQQQQNKFLNFFKFNLVGIT